MCLGSQTILFHLPNNIVSSAKVKCLENETQKHQVSFAGRRAVSTNRMVIKGMDISVYKKAGEPCFIFTHDRWKAPGAYRRQSAFCESSEKGLGIHESVLWCEEGHREGLRLTKCQRQSSAVHRFRIRVCKTEHRQVPVPQNEATGEEDLGSVCFLGDLTNGR